MSKVNSKFTYNKSLLTELNRLYLFIGWVTKKMTINKNVLKYAIELISIKKKFSGGVGWGGVVWCGVVWCKTNFNVSSSPKTEVDWDWSVTGARQLGYKKKLMQVCLNPKSRRIIVSIIIACKAI